MKKFLILAIVILLAAGCTQHKIKLETAKPLQIDMSLRVDVYQHVAKEADSVADFITGESPAKPEAKPQSALRGLSFIGTAYAQDALENFSAAAKEAMQSSKARRAELTAWEAKGVIGENSKGLVELRNSPAGADVETVNNLVAAENKDRMAIYGDSAARNNTSADDIGKVYAKSFQKSAPVGAPVEADSGWVVK